MNQEMRTRPAIDLDELDRQLQAGSRPPSRHPGSDPLHELAKIVGQEDPFRQMFSPDVRPEAVAPTAPPAGHLASAMPGPSKPASSMDAGGAARAAANVSERLDTRGLISRLEDEMKLDLRPALPAESAQPPSSHTPYDGAGAYGLAPEQRAPVPPLGSGRSRDHKRRSGFAGHRLAVLGGVMSLGLIGVVGVFAMKGNGVTGARKEAPIIASKAGPSKERPANPGGIEVPSQGSDLFQKTSDTASVKDTKVVNTIEQPVDLAAAKKDAPRVILPGLPTGSTPPAAAPISVEAPQATGAVAAAPATAGIPASSEPRRVRGVSIRNGEAVESPPSAAQTTASNGSSQAAPGAGSSVTKSATPAASTPPPAPKPVTPAARPSAQKEQASAPATPQPRAAKVVPLPRPAATVPESTDEDAPIALTPSKAASPPRVASLPAPAEPVPAPAPAAAAGGWAVQLASRPTESDARTAAQQLGQRYSSALSGATPRVVRGEANGNTVYRVRVSAGSKERAASLCEEIKTAGGSCWISAN